MYVSELIEYLKSMPQDAKVVNKEGGFIWGAVPPALAIVDKSRHVLAAQEFYQDGEKIVFV